MGIEVMEQAFRRLQYDQEFNQIVKKTIQDRYNGGSFSMWEILQIILDWDGYTVEEKLCLAYGFGHMEAHSYLLRCINSTGEEKDEIAAIFRR